MHYLNGFATRDKRFRFAPDWAAMGDARGMMPHLPDHMPAFEQTTPECPFRLMTSPSRGYLNTSFTEMRSMRQREGRPTVMLHAEDAVRLGINDGDRVVLGNARGQVVLHARIAEGMQPGVLVSESIWPPEAFETGIGINALTSDDPGPPLGGAVFHDTAVWMRPAAGVAKAMQETDLLAAE
jgi:anaerobic selenocysteine-containing dehydrogenase